MARKPKKEKIDLDTLKKRLLDPSINPRTFRKYFTVNEASSEAFAPLITYNQDLVDDGGRESALIMNFFNNVARRYRSSVYRKETSKNPNLRRIISEGDSWFQYPILLDDVIDHLLRDYAILSLGAGGDLLSDMLAQGEYLEFIDDERAEAFLISGGGNDLLGEGRLATVLKPFAPELEPADYVETKEFRTLLANVLDQFRQIFQNLFDAFPHLVAFCHGYDYAIPDSGRWLGEPMESKGIRDRDLQRRIIRVIMDRFNDGLEDIADSFQDRVFYVDCRNVVGKRWHDELHPTDEGYQAVAQRFRDAIDTVLPGPSTRRPVVKRGKEGFLKDPTELPERDRVLARRVRQVLGEDTPPPTSSAEADKIAERFAMTQEKISGGRDFLPARFLSDGHTRSEAVCRIKTQFSLGTGFLIASHDFIMTNNHVLEDEDSASSSIAEFDFEAGDETLVVRLQPERFFMTDERLDFTIVACDGSALSDRTPVPLLRNPATVTRGDRVNIIQHPSGRMKEIAIHNNEVINDGLQEVIHYETDTEPGSSGSAVFNNDWDLVALHHAGRPLPGGKAENEGIRISAVVAHLIGQQRGESTRNLALGSILDTVPDSSPMLGFFDVAGVVGDQDHEVEVPTFTGTGDFADIGFWNIENFNNNVGSDRVKRVASALSRLSMDVMGLVEIREGALARLVEVMRDNHGDQADFKVLDVVGGQDLAVLFDTETADVMLADDINDRHSAALATRTAGNKLAFPREPLFARCEVFQDGAPLTFMMIVVHFKAFGDAQSRARRKLAARILAEIIEDIRETEKLPVILGGDFNDELNTDVLRALQSSPDLLALTADDAVSGAASFVGDRHRSLIDHIIVSRDVELGEISGDDAAIVRLDKSTRDFADKISDHVPIVMRVVRRDSPVDGPEAPCDEPAAIDIPAGAQRVTIDFD